MARNPSDGAAPGRLVEVPYYGADDPVWPEHGDS